MKYFDSHAHYVDETFCKGFEDLYNEMNNVVDGIINVGWDIESSEKTLEMCNLYKKMYGAIGVHPSDVFDNCAEEVSKLYNSYNKHDKLVAIGEIGLDYHYDNIDKEKQQRNFIEQLDYANQIKLPVIIHSRDAKLDMINILNNVIKPHYGMVFHCFQPDMEMLQLAIKNNYYVSFAGPITYLNAKKSVEILEHVPLELLLIETDAPYLSPHPLRGQINTSLNLHYIAEQIAKIKKVSVEEIANITKRNAKNLFNIL